MFSLCPVKYKFEQEHKYAIKKTWVSKLIRRPTSTRSRRNDRLREVIMVMDWMEKERLGQIDGRTVCSLHCSPQCRVDTTCTESPSLPSMPHFPSHISCILTLPENTLRAEYVRLSFYVNACNCAFKFLAASEDLACSNSCLETFQQFLQCILS